MAKQLIIKGPDSGSTYTLEYTRATVRQMENKAKVKMSKEEENRRHILYKNIEDTFQGFFGSKVKLDPGKRRGKIIIEYTSNDDLERILGLISNNE